MPPKKKQKTDGEAAELEKWYAVDLKKKAKQINQPLPPGQASALLEALAASDGERLGPRSQPVWLSAAGKGLEARIVTLAEMQSHGAPGWWQVSSQYAGPEDAAMKVLIQQAALDDVQGKRPWRLLVREPLGSDLERQLSDASFQDWSLSDLVRSSAALVSQEDVDSEMKPAEEGEKEPPRAEQGAEAGAEEAAAAKEEGAEEPKEPAEGEAKAGEKAGAKEEAKEEEVKAEDAPMDTKEEVKEEQAKAEEAKEPQAQAPAATEAPQEPPPQEPPAPAPAAAAPEPAQEEQAAAPPQEPGQRPEATGEQEAAGEEQWAAAAKDSQQETVSRELEVDSPDDPRAKLTDPVVILTPDTTMNVMQSRAGGILMTLNEGGLQYLLAGARASVGLKAGRYMFEAMIVENLNQTEVTGNQARTPVPRNLLRIGVSLAGNAPILGDSEDGVCFDSEGNLLYNRKRSAVAQKFTAENTVAVVLNLSEEGSPNPSTISLFKDGQRACEPQPLPDNLKGKVLYPTVTFKNVTLHVHFGPCPHHPLPFRCRTVQEAAAEDVVVTSYPGPKEGKHEVVFPVMLPDEGTFDWLDWYLKRNPQYTELSERTIVEWAMRSGLWRPKSNSYKSSTDKPDMNFGIPHLDNGSVKQMLHLAATVQQRDFIVMEVRGNLMKQERAEVLERFKLPYFRRVARVMMGEPSQDYKEFLLAAKLTEKQAKSDADFKSKKQERARKRLIEVRQKQVERARKKAERMKKKNEELKRKRQEAEAKAAENGTEMKEEDEEKKEAEEKDEEEEEEEPEPMEETPLVEEEETPPKVVLTEAEKRDLFSRKSSGLPDISSFILGQSFSKFSLPSEEEDFDELHYDWQKPEGCVEHIRRWNLDRKITTRLEDIQPSEWFRERWQEWQRDLQVWHMKHMDFKDPHKRAALLAAARAAKEGEAAAKALEEKKGMLAIEGKKDEKMEDTKEAKEGEESKTGDDENKPPADANKEDGEKAEVNGQDTSKENGKDEKKEEEKEKAEEEEDPVKALVAQVSKQEFDVFAINDISDGGSGEPLYSNFAFEDWALLSLRFELHLLVHAFRRDCNDSERTGIHPDHLAFYYNKYYKKGLNPKNYGVDSIEDLVKMIRDTVVICMKVIESQITDDLETNEVFVKLTEESRRERQRRLDAGDQSAVLHFQSRPQDHVVSLGAGRTGIRPSAVNVQMQMQQQQQQQVAQQQMQQPVPAGIVQRPPVRLSMPQVGVRGYMSARPQQQWSQQQWPQQQWYAPRAVYGMRSPAVMAQQRAMMARSGPYQQGGWRYGR